MALGGGLSDKGFVAVVGAVNVDISGVSATKLIYGDSNPGVVTLALGGVGRNIAENLLRLGSDVGLITAVGDDANAAGVMNGCRELGLDISLSLFLRNARTSTYLCVSDCNGEIAAAVNDMEIYQSLTPEFLRGRLDALNSARLVVIDANIPAESVDFLAENCSCPMVADPVSVKKAARLKNALGRFAMIKPNRPEAEVLSDVEIRSDDDLPRAAEALLKKGLKRVFISLGARGAYYNDGKNSGVTPCFKSRIVNTTGCGDAFLAGAAAGLIDERDTAYMAKMGLACASVCAMSDRSVNPRISMTIIESIIKGEQYDDIQ